MLPRLRLIYAHIRIRNTYKLVSLLSNETNILKNYKGLYNVLSFNIINRMAHNDVYHRGKLMSASFYRVFPSTTK